MQAFYGSAEIGNGRVITMETGRLAKQAGGAVVVRLGDTMVLCTAVIGGKREGLGFFPLSVDYRESYAAGGRIPGGFFKREGRPTEKEILSSRLVDRCIRPLFADGLFNEVQIMVRVISADGENDADVLAGCGASLALHLAGAPFAGPVAEVRVGRVEGSFVINPTIEERETSDIDLVVAGKSDSIMMVEGEMKEISEAEMIDAIEFGHQAIKTICQTQLDMLSELPEVTPFEFTPDVVDPELVEKVTGLAAGSLSAHLDKPYNKQDFYGGIAEIKESVISQLLGDDNEDAGTTRADSTEQGWTAGDIKDAVSVVEKNVMRERILADAVRLDGRSLDEIRQIWCDIGYLPRAHGSSIFTRGETQVLASVTLGTSRDVQAIDELFDQTDRRFYLHYNFPPFCTGEAKMPRGASRREIGHGKLAERAISAMLPDEEAFPYTIRIVGDVLESNGSSSMATVCSSSMALMDAGVPIKKAVAGIAMGLITDGSRTAILSDILGTEDHLGDMDFKVTGTRDGITACQMDIKVDGLARETLVQALDQAKAGRDHILGKMHEAITQPADDLKPHAPRLTRFEIDPEYIGALIGPGGKVIQGIQRDTGTDIDISEKDGRAVVTIAATSGTAAEKAHHMIRMIVTEPEVGEDYEGEVVSILEFGPLVEILPGKVGLCHVSEMSYEYIQNVNDVVSVGDKLKVRLMEITRDGKLRLSRKPFMEKPEGYVEREEKSGPRPPRQGGPSRDGRRGGGGGGGRGRDRDRR